MSLTRDQIVRAEDLPKPKKITVTEWGGDVFVRMLPVGERGEWEDLCFDDKGKPKLAARKFTIETILYMVCDETGHPIFNAEDGTAVSLKNPDVLERIAIEAMRFNGLDLEAAKETAKNLPEAQTNDLSTS